MWLALLHRKLETRCSIFSTYISNLYVVFKSCASIHSPNRSTPARREGFRLVFSQLLRAKMSHALPWRNVWAAPFVHNLTKCWLNWWILMVFICVQLILSCQCQSGKVAFAFKAGLAAQQQKGTLLTTLSKRGNKSIQSHGGHPKGRSQVAIPSGSGLLNIVSNHSMIYAALTNLHTFTFYSIAPLI